MALTKLGANVANVQALGDKPTESATQVKVIFDKAGVDIKAFINDTLTVEADSTFATKGELADVVAAGIADNTVTDVKLSNTAGQIKSVVTGHLADDVQHITGSERTTWNASASETVKGNVELATATETTTGTDNTRAVHPAGLKVELDKKARTASGSYSGDGSAKTINVGFTPKFVYIAATNVARSYTVNNTQNSMFYFNGGMEASTLLKIVSGGFNVGTIALDANQSGVPYAWTAVG